MTTRGSVAAVSVSSAHHFSKQPVLQAQIIAGYGIEGDAHAGATVRHRSRARRDPTAPNLRQVHLLPLELLWELRTQGFSVNPGEMGENITTEGIPLLDLPVGTRLVLGREAALELTGLRNPCSQIDRFQPGLLRAVLDRDEAGGLVRKAGVMAIVVQSGIVFTGDPIQVQLPRKPHQRLQPV